MPQANAHAQALAQEQCRELLDRSSARTGVAGRVRDLLLARPADPPTAEHVARELMMSSRTLRERLAAERTSYRELLDEIRERLAEEMLIGDSRSPKPPNDSAIEKCPVFARVSSLEGDGTSRSTGPPCRGGTDGRRNSQVPRRSAPAPRLGNG
jgi:AraC-like DNA-binding protein